MKTLSRPGLLILSLLCCLHAQAVEDSPALAAPKVEISLSQQSHAVTSDLDIYVQLTNVTDSDIYLKNVQLFMPRQFAAARSADDNFTKEVASPHLLPRSQRLIAVPVPAMKGFNAFSPVFYNRKLLTFVPGDYDLRIVVTYQIPPIGDSPPGAEAQTTAIVKVALEPPLCALIWGGVAGALLLAVFIGVYRYWKRESGCTGWTAIQQAITLATAGAVSTSITLLLLQRLKGSDLPINLTVTDFYGGMVIGLFSYKMGDALYKRLFGGGSGKPDSETRSERKLGQEVQNTGTKFSPKSASAFK